MKDPVAGQGDIRTFPSPPCVLNILSIIFAKGHGKQKRIN